MTGRGVDQILPHPGGSRILEPYVQDARAYVQLAEARNGPIPAPVDFAYIWGDALAELDRVKPAVRIVNLETSITTSDERWAGKVVNYRMHPENVGCLTAARLDVCGLANNHVLDYGASGLAETLEVLGRAGLKTAGAGPNESAAGRPAIVRAGAGIRIVNFAFGTGSAGVPNEWAAGPDRSGIDLLPDSSDETAAAVVERVRAARGERDLVVVSIHWGSNWGYEVPGEHAQFAHRLIDGGIDLVHGHSSHHPRPIEVYHRRPILYGCGDFLNDYEGIAGHEEFRGDLVLMYFATLSADTRELTALEMTPLRIRKMRLERASRADAEWLGDTMDRVSRPYGLRAELTSGDRIAARWDR